MERKEPGASGSRPYERQMHHPYDQCFKALARTFFELLGKVYLEVVVHVAPQRIDLAYEPEVRDPRLGVLDRMAAQGPGMLEHFARRPSLAEVKECLRKRLGYEHERAEVVERDGGPAPVVPWLWILSMGRPRQALRAFTAEPMRGWPAGFWQSRFDEQMCFVVLPELPESEETLPLRLLGLGRVLARALVELRELPEGHVLRGRLEPTLLAFREVILQDLERTDDMTTWQQVDTIYDEWRERTLRQGRESEARALLAGLLAQRFGSVPAQAAERIEQADREALERWVSRVLTAATLDDVLA